MKPVGISVIIPIFNEEGNIQKLYNEINEVLPDKDSYEIVFVDDGSKDESFNLLKRIASKDKKVKIVKLMSNYGQSNAISAGITNCAGNIIVTMDSDMQHDPKDILPLIKKINEGYHVVCGWRKNRNSSDSLIRKTIPSKLANILVRIITGSKLNDSTGGMRAFTRRVVENIHLYGEMHRYLPLLALWKGFRVTEVPINIRKRANGKTNYNYTRIFRGFLDLLTIKFFMKYSTRPFHIFGFLGIVSFLSGFLINFFFAYEKIFFGRHLYQDLPSIILGVVLILLGIMFLGFGFIADMISYDAISSQKRETYLIDEIV
ncbi:MAG: glycosyltransferase family 2 protein [Candidatus Levybacteria bacterium]|nr:glycosyltransferase family 2 protein [Candidatus Levybacteria bacterium]